MTTTTPTYLRDIRALRDCYDHERGVYIIDNGDGTTSEYANYGDAAWAFEHPGEALPSPWDMLPDLERARQLAAERAPAQGQPRHITTGRFRHGGGKEE